MAASFALVSTAAVVAVLVAGALSGPGSSSATASPIADSYVTENFPDANYGTAPILRGDSSSVSYAYLKFAQPDRSVLAATLKFTAATASASGISVYRSTDESWTESSLTWTRHPAAGRKIASLSSVARGLNSVAIPPQYVNPSGSTSLIIEAAGASPVSIDSRETAHPAQLDLVTGPGRISVQASRRPSRATCVSTDCGPYAATLKWGGITVSGQTGYYVLIDGSQISDQTSSPYTFVGIDCDESHTFSVEAHDGAGATGPAYTTFYSAPACAVGDVTPPTDPSGLTVSAITQTSMTLSWSASTDSGGSGLSGYNANVDGVSKPLQTSLSRSLISLSCGTTYTVGVQAIDNAGNLSNLVTTSGTTSACTSGTPVNTAAPVVTGTAQQNQVLSTTNGTWTGTAPITFTYDWQRCVGTTCTDTGGTGSSYTLTASDVGSTMQAIVTGTNGVGSAPATSNMTAQVTGVGGVAPVWQTGPSLTGAPVAGHTLTAGNGDWGGTTSSFTYQWQLCSPTCGDISGATGSTYTIPSGSTDVGDTIQVVTTAHDGGASTAHASAPTAPIVSAFSSPSPSVSGEKVVASGLIANANGRGNGHDPQLTMIERAPNGHLFAAYEDPTSASDMTYHLVKSTDGGSTWNPVDTGDSGMIEAYVAVAPNNEVYVMAWNQGTTSDDLPSVWDYGVDAVKGGSPVRTKVPGNWVTPNVPYVDFAADASGNLFVTESDSDQSCSSPEACYAPQLAWTTGGPGNFTWHSTGWPTIKAATGTGTNTYRFGYTHVLADNNGGADIINSSDPSCSSTYAGNTEFSNPAYTQTTGLIYIQDRIYDWHTDDLNAPGGPTWTVHLIALQNRQAGGLNCNGQGKITKNAFSQDAMRDIYGFVHVMYYTTDSTGATAQEAVLNANGSLRTTYTPPNVCSSAQRITQDPTGRFFFLSFCGSTTTLDVWASDTTDGTTTGTKSTLSYNFNNYNYVYIAGSQGGTATDQKYLDAIYPYNGGSNINYFKINLDP